MKPNDDAEEKGEPTPDQRAAHEFLTELRTRIAIQPLYYQHGIEQRALESLYELFALARAAIKAHPGCRRFAQRTADVLNGDLRWLTAKWHRASEAGRLRSRDGGDEFRSDLAAVQAKLKEFAGELSQLAYDAPFADVEVAPPIGAAELDELLRGVRFGVPRDERQNGGIAPAQAEALAADELAHVEARRRAVGHQPADTPRGYDAVGLALSGGGIRSATFCLGVVQVLADRGLLRDVDFLSTVSGGGYTGSFVTTQLASAASRGDPSADLLGAPHGPDPAPIRGLRRGARFLGGGNLWARWGMVVETVVGMAFNWLMPLVVIAAFAIVGVLVKRALPRTDDVWLWFAGIGAAATALATVLFFAVEARRSARESATWPSTTLRLGAALTVAALCVWLADVAFRAPLPGLRGPGWTWRQLVDAVRGSPVLHVEIGWFGVFGALAAVVPAALRFVPLLEKPLVRKVVLSAALAVGGLIVPLLALLVFYVLYALGAVVEPRGEVLAAGTALDAVGAPVLATVCRQQLSPIAYADPIGVYWLGGAAAAVFVLLLLALDINATGPHRLYRRGLSRTFVEPRPDGSAPKLTALATIDPDQRAPYQLVNTTVNLPGSEREELRERRGDFFVFTKHWTGSPVIGYRRTADWRTGSRTPDLATAMAISGAAVSSSMGLGSIPPLRALLAFLNLRLGYWLRQPPASGADRRNRHPGFFCLLREMTGLAMSERQRWLNLSDGGHIENLGVYELLRRRCKFVVCVDGEGDPEFAFPGLMTLVRHARIDLGVEIDQDLGELRPDAATGLCRSHYHLCRIRYPGTGEAAGPVGLLLYLKLSLTGNESELIQRYRRNNPSFPHETTLDQFFDEEQFEAYRQLGVHIAEGLFARSLLGEPGAGAREPASVRDWFRRLARNLLESAPAR